MGFHSRCSGRSAVRRALFPALALLLGAGPAWAGPKEPTRYGIEAKFLSYDASRQIFVVRVLSREVGGFGGSSVGVAAPEDVKPQEDMELAVKPDGSVLSRTVIKASNGTGLDPTGTEDGFKKAVQAIPKDRALALSISENAQAGSGGPRYRLQTVVIRMTPAEIEARLRELLADEEPGSEGTPSAN